MLDASELPQPSAAAKTVSEELAARIHQRIETAGGSIAFDEYMQMALYEPALGYYMGGAIKFGKAGDFVTAPELSSLFGSCIANQCHEILQETGGSIVEFGGGTGALAAHILRDLEKHESLPAKYSILELSPALRQRQYQTIAAHAPSVLDKVEWISALPSAPFHGVMLANEIVDALPVRVFKTLKNQIVERKVRSLGDDFDWVDVPAEEGLVDRVRVCCGPEIVTGNLEYVSEVNFNVVPWIHDLARHLDRGVALIIDYGFPRHEYFHAQRSSGTLTCHFRHRSHTNPFCLPGLQDITAWVDFTNIAESALEADLAVLGFAEQSNFLLSNGLIDAVERRSADASEVQRQRLAYETKILTLPTEMGARFKVLALGSRYNSPLRGFQLRDDRHRL